MAGDSRLSARFGADTSDFKAGITEINRELKLVESGFKATASTMDDWSNNADGLNARMGALTKEIDLQKEKVDALRIRHEQMAKANGENSIEAQNAQIEFNKEAEKLGKLQTELNQTGTSLNALKEKSGGLKGAIKDMGAQFENLKQQIPAVGTAFNLLSNPITLAVAGIGAFIKLAKESVSAVVDYNKQIREMGQVTGLGAEEISRLVQVGDDWGISIEDLRTSLAFMNKTGLTPSIDNLAKLADEYVSTSDKSAFAEKAVKILGRGYQTLIPLLALGGQGLKDATGAIEKSLIATNESIAASRKYEVAVDGLTDAWTGFKYTVGNDVIPVLTDLFNAINKQNAQANTYSDTYTKYTALVEAGLIPQDKTIRNFETAAEATARMTAEIKKAEAAETTLYGAEDKLIAAHNSLVTATDQVTEAQNYYNDAIDEYVKRSPLFLTQYAKFTQAQTDAKNAADKLTQTYDDMNLAIGGQLGPTEKNFTKTQDDLNKKMGEIQGKIDEAIRNGYDPLGDKVQGLQGDYNNLKDQYDINATEHDDATKRIMFNILEQRAAIGGLTAEEIKYLGDIATAWGLPDQATLDYMANADASLNWLANHPGDVAGAEAILTGQKTAWDLTKEAADNAKQAAIDYATYLEGIKDKTVTITTYHKDILGNAYQHGANFVVPPGYPNDSFPMRVESGEQVIVIPKGIQRMIMQANTGLNNQINGANSGGGMTGLNRQLQPAMAPINITINGAPDNEMQMRRLARYVATEIQRKQS